MIVQRAIGGGLLVAAMLAGCGSDLEPYSAEQACDVEATAIEAVLGTDRFDALSGRGALPLDQVSGEYTCDVLLGEDRDSAGLTITAEINDQLGIDTAQQVIDKYQTFEVAGGGTGAIYPRDDGDPQRLRAVWVCGSVTGRVSGSVSEGWTERAARQLIDHAAMAAGCLPAPATS